MKNNDLITKRLQSTARFARTFQTLPFVEAFLLNGSLALGKSRETSDIDILTVTKVGRLYTARFFMLALGVIMGKKRSKDENKPHAGKFCFNYFISADYLKIPTGRGEKTDQYCADNYSSSVLLWEKKTIFNEFFSINAELFNKSRVIKDKRIEEQLLSFFPVSNVTSAKRSFETILNGKFGDWLEKWLKHLQISLIKRDERTKKYPELILYNDVEARFHPPKY